MGQEIRGIPEDSALRGSEAAGTDGEPTIGRYLASQRRLRGVSLEDLAELTKIPRRSLQRLEEGAFDQQADGFARGFVRTVAEALGLDAEEAVLRLLGEPPDGDDERHAHHLALKRWGAAAVLLFGAGAVLLALWLIWSGLPEASEGRAGEEIVYRRDAVRELAQMERATGESMEPLASGRERATDRGADPARGGLR
jgi:transcriptional regulator with XRE-family HTH domain